MNAYSDFMIEALRLLILQELQKAPAYTHNAYTLKKLLQQHGEAASTDTLKTQLQWLHEQGLVLVKQEAIWIATLTARGDDVANGLSHVPNVARPEPR